MPSPSPFSPPSTPLDPLALSEEEPIPEEEVEKRMEELLSIDELKELDKDSNEAERHGMVVVVLMVLIWLDEVRLIVEIIFIVTGVLFLDDGVDCGDGAM